VSFYPHPAVALGRAAAVERLLSLDQMRERLSDWGISLLALVHFTDRVRTLSARQFLKDLLIDRLQTRRLVIGGDARVGEGGEADANRMCEIMNDLGASAEIVPLLSGADGMKIGSRAIRDAVKLGAVERAALMLGEAYQLDGRVVRGDGRGRQLGFPTANIRAVGQVVPGNGVYRGRAALSRGEWKAVINVGTRPTIDCVGTPAVSVEAHLLSYSQGEFYGERIQLSFEERLRDERKFGSLEELRLQIEADIECARGG
jgi:riboflavin kinase / FMN adenylyltransferase